MSDGFELLARGAAAAKIAIEPTASSSTCANDAEDFAQSGLRVIESAEVACD
jgi:hypothetical protein